MIINEIEKYFPFMGWNTQYYRDVSSPQNDL